MLPRSRLMVPCGPRTYRGARIGGFHFVQIDYLKSLPALKRTDTVALGPTVLLFKRFFAAG